MLNTKMLNTKIKDSNWQVFAGDLDMGTLDMDNFAQDMGFRNFADLDASISPRSLVKRNAERFVNAARLASLRAEDLTHAEIVTIANKPAW